MWQTVVWCHVLVSLSLLHQHCPVLILLAAGWSLSVWPLILLSSHVVCAYAFSFPICIWDPVTGQLCSDGVHGLGALSHVSRLLWAYPGTQPLAWLLPHSVLSGLGPGWPVPVPCLQIPPGWTAHEEPMLRLGCSPVSTGHLRLDCVLLWPHWL